ncbi:MAG: anti-sigma regulatory factor [bacterium]|nr:anti-sigma regulatory factor [bacterium]
MKVEKEIEAGDFASAGGGASKIKATLKQLAIPPKIVRRVAIAAYEAEINVVAHSVGGRIIALISPESIVINIVDDGPGIPDIEQALVPGYSTARPEVREMGFGAGLGLPNIKNNVDYLKITVEEGGGTTLRLVVFVKSWQEDKK